MFYHRKTVVINLLIFSIFYNKIRTYDINQTFDSLSSHNINFTENEYGPIFKSLGFNNDVFEDSFLSTPQLVKKYGYNAEKHTVATEDGYLLEMHRIAKPGGQPILLMHGLLDSSATWVMMGPGKGLGYLLSDLGYDVWMGNVRGNTYSKKHKYLSTLSNKFWQFSLDEMGKYDMPAMVDYVLSKTNFKKIHYIGHSQGTAIFWILCHYWPEYNEKILSMQALGPVAFLSHCKSPIVVALASHLNSFESLTKIIGLNEFFPNLNFVRLFAQAFCRNGSITEKICENIIFVAAGYNEAKLNKTMVPVITSHCPAGASVRQITHYLQLIKSGHFRPYEFNSVKNVEVYGYLEPSDYDLSKVKVKVALHYSQNDFLATPEDVMILRRKLPNLIGAYLVSDKNYNHLDFLWAIDAKILVYKKVFNILHDVEKGRI